MESGFQMDHTDFQNINLWEEKTLFFGGTNIIHNHEGRLTGVADSRRFGAVINKFE